MKQKVRANIVCFPLLIYLSTSWPPPTAKKSQRQLDAFRQGAHFAWCRHAEQHMHGGAQSLCDFLSHFTSRRHATYAWLTKTALIQWRGNRAQSSCRKLSRFSLVHNTTSATSACLAAAINDKTRTSGITGFIAAQKSYRGCNLIC